MEKRELYYRGYFGSVIYNLKAQHYYGYILQIPYSIAFTGENVEELEKNFQQKVERYLDNGTLEDKENVV